jgi:hypothetical protein
MELAYTQQTLYVLLTTLFAAIPQKGGWLCIRYFQPSQRKRQAEVPFKVFLLFHST